MKVSALPHICETLSQQQLVEPGTVLSFVVVVSSADDTPVETTATTTEGERRLAVEVTEDKSRARSGDEIPYTVSYANLGGEVLEDVIIVFVIPASTSLVTASDGGASDPEGVVEWALDVLDPREEEVIRMRYGIGRKMRHTLEEIGKEIGVTRERVRQIQLEALRNLRQMLESHGIDSRAALD